MTGHDDLVEMQRVDQDLYEIRVGFDRVFVARPGAGQAMPRQVDGDDARCLAELTRPAFPHVQRAIGAVDQQDGHAIGIALFANMRGHAADIDEARAIVGVACDQGLGR